MAKATKSTPSGNSAIRAVRIALPQGYRQGIITAITVLLGFSLAFLRFWGFEAEGVWTWRSVFATVVLVLSIGMQIGALYRALRVADDDESEYQKTVRWFIASTVVLAVAVIIALIVA
jgi:hypothetical protein